MTIQIKLTLLSKHLTNLLKNYKIKLNYSTGNLKINKNKFERIWVGPELQKPVPTISFGKQIYESLSKAKNDEIMFIDAISGKRTTYKEFLKLSCRLARSLKNCGYQTNDVIGISSENNEFYFIPIVASLFLGIITAPINQLYTQRELSHLLSITEPKVIFSSKKVLNSFLKQKDIIKSIEKIIVLDSEKSIEGTESMMEFIDKHCETDFDENKFKPVDVNPLEHVATVLCSSGTTGFPKGVMITHDNIATRNNQLTDTRLSELKHETHCACLPFFHAFGFMMVVAGIPKRSTFVIMQRFEEELFLKAIETYKINVTYIVPPIANFLARSELPLKYDLKSLEEILVGAAPLSQEIEAKLFERNPSLKNLRQGYGLTEGTITLTLMRTKERKLGSSGKLVPSISGCVKDIKTGELLGPNEIGELCFKGKMVSKGYYNNPEATKLTYVDGWLHTGDIGYFDEDGFIFIVDRLKELIKYKGFQVPPAEIEGILLTHPGVKDVGVVGKPDEVAGELPTAFIVKNPEKEVTEKEIFDFVAREVSKPKQLHGGVYFVNYIPKTASGKIMRRILKEMLVNEAKKL